MKPLPMAALTLFFAAPAAAAEPYSFVPLLEELHPALVCAEAARGSEPELKACFAQLDFGPYRGVLSGSPEAAYKNDAYFIVSNLFRTSSPSEQDWADLVAYIGCIERASYAHPVSREGDVNALTKARAEVKESCLDHRFAISGEPWFDMPELDTDEERMTAVASELARRTFANLALRNGWLARAMER